MKVKKAGSARTRARRPEHPARLALSLSLHGRLFSLDFRTLHGDQRCPSVRLRAGGFFTASLNFRRAALKRSIKPPVRSKKARIGAGARAKDRTSGPAGTLFHFMAGCSLIFKQYPPGGKDVLLRPRG